MSLSGQGAADHVQILEQWLKRPRMATERPRYFGPLMEINYAHAAVLAEQAIVRPAEATAIFHALDAIRADPDRIERHRQQEDLYLMVEAAVIEEAGSAGGQLHIGRSRNDITATMTRMVARAAVDDVRQDLLALIQDLVALAGVHVDTIMPGYTHLRPAQPTTFAPCISMRVRTSALLWNSRCAKRRTSGTRRAASSTFC